MAVAVVSARLRSALIDAAAAYRQGNELEVLHELVRIVGVLHKFPLPPRSPQADMIATAVQQRATLPERQVLQSLVLTRHSLFPTSGKVCQVKVVCIREDHGHPQAVQGGSNAACLAGTVLEWMLMLQSFLNTFVSMGVP